MGFTEITPEQRATGRFRSYRATREWQKDRTGMLIEIASVLLPGHKLPNGNWLVPTACIDVTEQVIVK